MGSEQVMYIPKISTALQTESVDGDENEMSLIFENDPDRNI